MFVNILFFYSNHVSKQERYETNVVLTKASDNDLAKQLIEDNVFLLVVLNNHTMI